MRTILTKENKEILCKEYLEGKSITALSKENYNEVSVGFINYKMEIVKEFQSIIDNLINKENSNQIYHKNDKAGSNYRCAWRGRRQVLKILTLLYGNSNIHLNRKYNKYIRMLATVADKDMV